MYPNINIDINICTQPNQLLWNRWKMKKAITGYEYAHHPYYPVIAHFVSPFIDYAIPDASTYEKTRRQRATTTKRKSTNDKMVQRGNQRINVKHRWHKMKKCLTQIQSNKLVSIKLSFSISIQGFFVFCCTLSALTQIVRDLNLLGSIKTIFRLSPYQMVEVLKT